MRNTPAGGQTTGGQSVSHEQPSIVHPGAGGHTTLPSHTFYHQNDLAVAVAAAVRAAQQHPSSAPYEEGYGVPSGARGSGWTPTIQAQLAGYAYSGLQEPSTFYRDLLQERTMASKKTKVAGILSTLKRTHLELAGFTPTTEFTTDVIGLNFAPEPFSNRTWHRGIFGIGHFLKQTPDELLRQSHMDATRDANPHLQQTLGHALSTQGAPPPLPTSLSDLIAAFRRHYTFHLHTLGNSPIGQLSQDIAIHLQTNEQHLDRSGWMTLHGPSLICYFNQEAQAFARDVITERALNDNYMSGLSIPSTTQLAYQMITRAPIPTLPTTLQGSTHRPPPPVLPPTSPPPPANPAAGRRLQQRQPQQLEQSHRDQQPPSPPNPNLPQGYRSFWESFGPTSPPTNHLLSKMNLTPRQALAELGLGANDCYNYHVRECRNPRCNRGHNPTRINPTKASTHLARLQQAKQQL